MPATELTIPTPIRSWECTYSPNGLQLIPTDNANLHDTTARFKTLDSRNNLAPGCGACGHPFFRVVSNWCSTYTCEACGGVNTISPNVVIEFFAYYYYTAYGTEIREVHYDADVDEDEDPN